VFDAFHLVDEVTARANVELPALLAERSPPRDAATSGEAAGPSRAHRLGHVPARSAVRDTKLRGGTRGNLGALAGLEG